MLNQLCSLFQSLVFLILRFPNTRQFLSMLILSSLPALAHAQSAVQVGERLSTYLRRQGMVPGVLNADTQYLPGLIFKRASEFPKQSLLRTQLLTRLHMQMGRGNNSYSELVKQLPATGRLLLSSVDADYLSLHPEIDPRIAPGDEVLPSTKPLGVLVLIDEGYCQVPYYPGVQVLAYLQSCGAQAVDTTWLVQPTGQIHRLNVGLWNAGQQVVPMPGAWLLAPRKESRLNPATAEQMALFLATQGSAKLPTHYTLNQWVKSANPVVFKQYSEATPLRSLPISSSSWGWVGLLQTPTARMRPAGSASFTASRVAPYSRYSIMLQPFDWLEGGFRYTKITNRLFGSFAFSGDQKFLDKNIDAKVRLWKESAYIPEVAVGVNDVGGTALFASEYLVASKRFGNFDASLGVAWGYLGASGDTANPLGLISSKFNNRPTNTVGLGGKLATDTYFRGRTALFGGVQWHTPWDDVVLKLEYDGNNYRNEALNNPQTQSSRINYGLVYKASNSMNLHLGVERGNTLSVAVSLFENFSTLNTPKVSDPKPLAVSTGLRPSKVDWKQTLERMQQQTDWEVGKVEQRGSEVKLSVRNGNSAYYAETLDRAAEVLHQDLPADVKWFTLNHKKNGTDVGQHVVNRDDFVARRTEYGLTEQRTTQERAVSDVDLKVYPEQAAIEGHAFPYRTLHEEPVKRFNNKFALGFRQVLGGADGFLYQFVLANDTRINFTENTWLEGRLAYRLIDNFEKFQQRGDSRLPQVRTNLREYAVTSDFVIPHLAFKHMGRLADGHYYGIYGGLLEQMFAGVGAEYLYRPFNSRYALGIDVNQVRQRAFEQDFSLQSYQVNTGHVTAYVDTGVENILATVSVGQYLAGDKGVTVDLSREFRNGVRMGAFATRTNVSAADFGEGSFDKGIYMTVPFSAFFTKSIPGDANFLWRPLTRDGGAKLNRGFSLYGETEVRNHKALSYRAGSGG